MRGFARFVGSAGLVFVESVMDGESLPGELADPDGNWIALVSQ
jgi:hypothetical protein